MSKEWISEWLQTAIDKSAGTFYWQHLRSEFNAKTPMLAMVSHFHLKVSGFVKRQALSATFRVGFQTYNPPDGNGLQRKTEGAMHAQDGDARLHRLPRSRLA